MQCSVWIVAFVAVIILQECVQPYKIVRKKVKPWRPSSPFFMEPWDGLVWLGSLYDSQIATTGDARKYKVVYKKVKGKAKKPVVEDSPEEESEEQQNDIEEEEENDTKDEEEQDDINDDQADASEESEETAFDLPPMDKLYPQKHNLREGEGQSHGPSEGGYGQGPPPNGGQYRAGPHSDFERGEFRYDLPAEGYRDRQHTFPGLLDGGGYQRDRFVERREGRPERRGRSSSEVTSSDESPWHESYNPDFIVNPMRFQIGHRSRLARFQTLNNRRINYPEIGHDDYTFPYGRQYWTSDSFESYK